MINAGSTELNNLWKNVLHNQAEDYIIPESDVNVMCPYDCVSTNGNTVTGYNTESYCNVNALATGTTTVNRNKKIATFEWNYWVLDGTFEVLDDNETVKGFVSTAISNENCEYDVNPFIFFDTSTAFPLRKNQTLKFNPPTNETPASITIQSSSSGGILNSIDFNIEEMLEEDNLTEREYVNLYSSAINTSTTNTRAVIIFTKTLMPYRRARLTEYNNGYKFFKNKYDLLTFTHTRTVALAMDELPQNDLHISFVDLEGVFDIERTDSPFKIRFNSSHPFYVYYGYKFDEYGWSYVMADYLRFESLEINRDSIETTFNMQSTLQMYNSKYGVQLLNVEGQTQSYPYNWTTFKGFLTAISSVLNIADFTYSTNDILYLNTSMSKWQQFLAFTAQYHSEDCFNKLPLKEVIQQICAFLRCVLIRQPYGDLRIKYCYENATILDTIIAPNIFSYPTKTENDTYKTINISTPRVSSVQNDDTRTSTGEGSQTTTFEPLSKTFTVDNVSVGSTESIKENIVPLGYVGETDCWLWGAGLWQNYANHYSRCKRAVEYEISETLINPLLQVFDYIQISNREGYSNHNGVIEKIEINYDGSFKGAIKICDFYHA